MRLALRRLITASAIATLALGVGMTTATAGAPDFTVDFPAGQACAGFDLRIEGWGGKQHSKEFTDSSGNVRSISAGTGAALTYTNLSTGATMSTRSNGATNHTSVGSDGTQTVKTTGHNLLILSTTDVPAGPSTTLFVGQVVFTIDTGNVWTVLSARGNSTDICAALTE